MCRDSQEVRLRGPADAGLRFFTAHQGLTIQTLSVALLRLLAVALAMFSDGFCHDGAKFVSLSSSIWYLSTELVNPYGSSIGQSDESLTGVSPQVFSWDQAIPKLNSRRRPRGIASFPHERPKSGSHAA